MKKRIAVDVAMLLPPEIEQQAMDMNRRLIAGQDNPPIRLDKNPCLPHATLVMAGLEKDIIFKIAAEMRRLVSDVMPFEARIFRSHHFGTEEEPDFCELQLEMSKPLEVLHAGTVEIVSPFAVKGVTKDMFTEGDNTDDFIPPYVETFIDRQCLDKYRPHITIGHGPLPEVEPRTFTATTVGICHLGNWGTCRKVLG